MEYVTWVMYADDKVLVAKLEDELQIEAHRLINITNIRRFKPGRERWIFKAIKIHSTTYFGGGGAVKQSVPCRKILRDVKELPEGSGGWLTND
jgi:transcription elongation factor